MNLKQIYLRYDEIEVSRRIIGTMSSGNDLHLSRLRITGELSETTPWVVIREVADAHGISMPDNLQITGMDDFNIFVVRNLISTIHLEENSLPRVGSSPFTPEVAISISRFVNIYVPWGQDELDHAFRYLCLFSNSSTLPIIDETFEYGLQVPANIHCLNACMLLKLCQFHDIPTNFYTTIGHMAAAVRLVITDDRAIISRQLAYVRPSLLPNLYMIVATLSDSNPHGDAEPELTLDRRIEIDDEFHSSVSVAVLEFANTENLIRRVEPRSSYEAVALASLIYKVDLSEATHPVVEYNRLRAVDSVDGWIPECPYLAQIVATNPLRLRLDLFFNPRIPFELYYEDDLLAMARNEGYTTHDLREESAYSLLVTSYLSPMFYHGLHPTISNTNTPFSMELVNDLETSDVICYGLIGTGLIAFTYTELAEYFRLTKCFVNPADEDKACFTEKSICKLKVICQSIFPGDVQSSAIYRGLVLQNISITELLIEGAHNGVQDFYDYFLELEDEEQLEVRELFNCMFILAMNTRGWTGEGDYPIERAPVDNQNEVDVRVTESIADFHARIEHLGDAGAMIMDLPMWQHRHDGWEVATSSQDGQTIARRLDMLEE